MLSGIAAAEVDRRSGGSRLERDAACPGIDDSGIVEGHAIGDERQCAAAGRSGNRGGIKSDAEAIHSTSCCSCYLDGSAAGGDSGTGYVQQYTIALCATTANAKNSNRTHAASRNLTVGSYQQAMVVAARTEPPPVPVTSTGPPPEVIAEPLKTTKMP